MQIHRYSFTFPYFVIAIYISGIKTMYHPLFHSKMNKRNVDFTNEYLEKSCGFLAKISSMVYCFVNSRLPDQLWFIIFMVYVS